MHNTFLSNPRTIPCINRDFAEWHQGIPRYGFWAVVINDPASLELWNKAHAHVKRFIHPGYQRAPHVTIAACGLMHRDHFSGEQLRQQSRLLETAEIAPFYLRINPSLDSFTTAPFLMIDDPAGAIGQIRALLRSVAGDDAAPEHYRPHITLGFYRSAFDTADVSESLAGFTYPETNPVRVTELSFCTYETRSIQGCFEIVENIHLNEN